jgi:hypothetical protein
MRRRYRWNPRENRLVEIDDAAESGIMIIPDLPDVVSPIDGSIIRGRAGMREHNRRHNVTHPSDFKETWARAREERARFFREGPRGEVAPHVVNALMRKK